VVFDHYGLSAREHRAVASGRPALAIDDLADRPLGADLVADFSPARMSADYADLVPPETRLLLGPAYALVRPEFTRLREAALARRASTQTVTRIQVSLGLTDVGGVTGRVVNRLLPRLSEAHLDVVLGAEASSRAAVESLAAHDPRVRALVQVRDMAPLTAGADLAVGAGGSSTWERAVLGLPTVMLVLADNQVPTSEAVARLGAAELVDARAPDFEAAFDRAFTGLMRNPDRRARMSAAAAKLCDGMGAGRVAEALLARL
jgi:UDP-2,4-diacetamido-2,4,6-trideoxy-beta-L-altropyranose hydrolase